MEEGDHERRFCGDYGAGVDHYIDNFDSIPVAATLYLVADVVLLIFLISLATAVGANGMGSIITELWPWILYPPLYVATAVMLVTLRRESPVAPAEPLPAP